MKDKEKQFKERVECGIAYCEDTPNKQIEEMSKIMCGNDCEECAKESANFYGQTLEEARNNKCLLKNCAKTLYEQGYRKIDKDSVVLSKEKYEKLKNESIDKLFADDTFFKEEFKANEEYLRKRANRDYIKLVKKQSSKETAEKILNELYCSPKEQIENKIKELARFIGVKIKE